MTGSSNRPQRAGGPVGVGIAALMSLVLVVACGSDGQDDAASDEQRTEVEVAPVRRISQPTELGSCPGLPGTEENFTVEPTLAVNPTDPDNLIAAWQQDRSFASRGNVAAYSTDGGDTWEVAVVPGANTCARGHLGIADAWLTFDAGGTAYLASLAGRPGEGGEPIVAGVIVNASTDGGRTWSDARRVTEYTAFDDKPAIMADPNAEGVVYAVWERSEGEGSCGREGPCRPVVLFARSDDGALSWSDPEPIAPPQVDGVRQNNARVLVLPDGTLRVFYEQRPDVNTNDAAGLEQRLLMVSSDDGGRSWSEPSEILTVHQYFPFTPSDGRFYALFNEAVTVDDAGNIHVVATHNESAETTAGSRVELLTSTDGGVTWSPPEGVATLDGFATLPTVAASTDSGVAVTWYDFASDSPDDEGVTFTYRAAVRPAGTDEWGQHDIVEFDAERCGLFSPEGLPGPDVPWIGEYFGLVPLVGGGFATALGACPPAADLGVEDILFTTLR